MSLLWKELQQQEKPQVRRRGAPQKQMSLSLSGPLGCSNCTLNKEPLQHPKMPASGSAKPIFYVLGEAPGKTEDAEGRQFVGASGELLRPQIPEKWEPYVRYNNAINCRPPGNRDPSALELACCTSRVEADIAATKPAVILCFGGIPLQWLTRSQVATQGYAGGRQHFVENFERGMPIVSNWRGRKLPVRIGGHTCWAYVINHPAWLLHSRKDKRFGAAHVACFNRDVATAFYEYERGLPPPFVEDPADYRKHIERVLTFGKEGLLRIERRLAEIAQRENFAVDIETNGKRPYKIQEPKILTVAVGSYDDVLAFGLDHPDCRWSGHERKQLDSIFRDFLLKSGRKWAHYLKMEQEWFAYKYGEDVLYETEWGDTHAQAHAIDERAGKELEDLTLLYFGFNLKEVEDLDRARLSEYPLERVLTYNGIDTKYTDPLSSIQAEVITKLGLSPEVYENLVRISPSLVRMQLIGLVRNEAEIEKLEKELLTKEVKIVRKILEHKDVISYKERHAKFNPNSNPDLLAFFKWAGFDKLKNVDEDALLEVKHPVAKLVLEMRGEKKLSSTYVTPLKKGGKHVATDGRVHATFNQSVTITTRLASSDPNAQNYPRRERKEIRRVIGCPPGSKFVAMDFGQLEARVVAMLTKCPVLVKETWNGDDIHGVWTEKLGKRFVPKLLAVEGGFKKIRDAVKNLWTFPQFFRSQLYSIGVDLSNRWGVEVSESALQPFSEEFWGKYGRVLQWQEELIESYWEYGYVETAHGFRRHEPMNENEIVNLPIQGTAAQIVLDAQYRIDRKAYKLSIRHRAPIMNVHDDLSFYFPDASLEEDIEWAAREMCLCSFDFINVPLAVEVLVGDNWCDKSEIHTFTSHKDFANG